MARNRHSLSYQAKQILDSKLRIGESKHELKRKGEDVSEWIFSYSTYTSYLKHINYCICRAHKIPPNAKGLRDVSSAYYCRDDLKGKVLDRKAMLICSQALGHNREAVLQNYLY